MRAPLLAPSLFAVLSVLAAPARAQLAGSQARMQDGLPYRLWSPPAYDKNMKYPLVVYLHGAGQRGTDNNGQISGSAEMLAPFVSMAWQAQNPAFVIAPQCPPNGQWVDWPWAKGSYELAKVPESAGLKTVRAIIAALRTEFSVDPDRIYVVGLSMGGYGTWDMIMRTPDLFAGAVASDGGASPSAAAALKRFPVWSHHDADDGVVPVSGDREMYAALAAAGGMPTYTEYASGGHGAWVKVGANPLYPMWLFAQRRGVPPTAVPQLAFSPTGGAPSATPPTIAMTSSLAGATIRYTLNGMVPTAAMAMAYAQPFMLTAGGVVQGLAISGMGGGQISVFHAATFAVGATADGGAGADAARAGDGATATSDAGPPSTSPDMAAPASGRDGPPAVTPPPGSRPEAGGSTPATDDPAADGGAHSKAKSGGCALGGRATGTPGLLLALAALFLSRLRRR